MKVHASVEKPTSGRWRIAWSSPRQGVLLATRSAVLGVS
jgi:hypothetical protein